MTDTVETLTGRLNGIMSAYQSALARAKKAEDDATALRASLAADLRYANLRPDAMIAVPPVGPTVYVLRDATNIVLYVGMTDNVVARLGQHAMDKPWWPNVVTADVFKCPTRAEAARLERQLIAFLAPLHNIVGLS